MKPASAIQSACTVALHMHQPLLPPLAEGGKAGELISNLQSMGASENDGDRYNAQVLLQCYRRMGHLIPALVDEGLEPRIMLDYSGTLLWGLELMREHAVFEDLKKITADLRYRDCTEWLGTAWGHPHAPSTPEADFRLHLAEWKLHFASMFGSEALSRVKGFSPPEMAIPNHPDDAFAFVSALKEFGYEWMLVQEHTVELIETERSPQFCHVPHLLICRNSSGDSVQIVCLIKTQGSDTKLVGQMQPWFEAKGLSKTLLNGKSAPPVVTQIADGENGGVMMHEFPPKFREVVNESSGTETPLVLGSEYLRLLRSMDINEADFPKLQPAGQGRLWRRCGAACGAERMTRAITELQKEDPRFTMQGGSWTANISWVKGYEGLMLEMHSLSEEFHTKVVQCPRLLNDPEFANTRRLFLASQTSCFRYWGQGVWTDHGRSLIRLAHEKLREI